MTYWKTIEGFNRYLISTDGQVISLPKRGNKNKTTLLKPNKDKRGYYMYYLYADGKRTCIRAHILVAKEWLSNKDNKPTVNHKNGIKTDNDVSNLEWSTHKENINHAWDNGLNTPNYGESNGFSKLTKDEVLCIRNLYPTLSLNELSKTYSTSVSNISSIINKKTWKHI